MLVSGLRSWFFSIDPHECSGLGQSLGPSLFIEIGFMTGPVQASQVVAGRYSVVVPKFWPLGNLHAFVSLLHFDCVNLLWN